MSPEPSDTGGESVSDRLLGRLDHMVDAGRVTEAEAQRMRAATSPAERDDAASAIRARHAGEKLEAAVARGGLTRAEADTILQRLRDGEHSASLREQVRAASRQSATTDRPERSPDRE